jgi:16S rRNA (adenine1518-N6/adenine1519-N6)-dimethyltransferase
MTLDGLPPLGESLAAEGLLADKGLGQHFLLDLNICRKIVRLAGPVEDQAVIEVGPGPGGLTRALLEAGARVIAIERDARFLPVLRGLERAAAGRLTLLQADALDVDEIDVLREANVPLDASIISNLPYNIGTPLLIKWLIGRFRPSRMTLMFQKEVAERIIAATGSEAYGRLAVLCQALCQVRVVLDLPPRAFSPPPRVSSAVVTLTPLAGRPDEDDLAALQTVTRFAFGQRRKMLRSALRDIGGETLCEAGGIDPAVRAETVPIDGFLRLAKAWRRNQAGGAN